MFLTPSAVIENGDKQLSKWWPENNVAGVVTNSRSNTFGAFLNLRNIRQTWKA